MQHRIMISLTYDAPAGIPKHTERFDNSMTPLKSSAELKACAKEHLFGKYGTVISANLWMYLILFTADITLLMVTDTGTVPGTILYYLLAFLLAVFSGLFTAGSCFFNLKLVCGHPLQISDIFYGFRSFPQKTLKVQLWISVLNYAAMLPCIILSCYLGPRGGLSAQSFSYLILLYTLALLFSEIAAIFVKLLYAQAFYLMYDFPQYTWRELLSTSRDMMKGQKGRLFYLFVSFLPLFLLSLLSCGIALLWVVPYMNATLTEFYLDLIRHRRSSC